MTIKAIILIGGPSKGTRFRPLSLDLPKPLFPIAGFPILRHHIQACVSKLPREELKEIVLLGFYDPSKIQDFILKASIEFSIPIKYHVESSGLGTGGGLYRFRTEILEGLDDSSYVFVLHCDVFCSFPLAEILSFHKSHGKDCTILGTKVPSGDSKNYGIIVEDRDTHEVLHYVEKPDTFVSDMASCGIYLFSKSMFNHLSEFAQSAIAASQDANNKDDEAYLFVEQNVLPNGDVKIQLEQDILVSLAQKRGLYVFETKDWFLPIKHVGITLSCAEQLMRQYRLKNPEILAKSEPAGPTIIGDVMIDPTAQIHPTAKLGPNVSIGKHVVIGAGVRVKQSIILDNVEIKERACVMYSIIGWFSVIGQWSRVEGEPSQQSVQDVRDCRLTLFGNDVTTAREVCVRRCIVLPHKSLNENYSDQTIL